MAVLIGLSHDGSDRSFSRSLPMPFSISSAIHTWNALLEVFYLPWIKATLIRHDCSNSTFYRMSHIAFTDSTAMMAFSFIGLIAAESTSEAIWTSRRHSNGNRLKAWLWQLRELPSRAEVGYGGKKSARFGYWSWLGLFLWLGWLMCIHSELLAH